MWFGGPFFLGGAIGGMVRSLLTLRIEFPYLERDSLTGQLVFIPGFVGDLVLGPVAALVLGGAGAATFDFQTAYDARGFWGPLIASITAGLASAQVLQTVARARVSELQETLVERAEDRLP
jgi:hypothetical protein